MGNPAQLFQQWINLIKDTVIKDFVPALTLEKMAISVAAFNAGTRAIRHLIDCAISKIQYAGVRSR
jgi:hypothetical protein